VAAAKSFWSLVTGRRSYWDRGRLARLRCVATYGDSTTHCGSIDTNV